jgi:hypothetical protein
MELGLVHTNFRILRLSYCKGREFTCIKSRKISAEIESVYATLKHIMIGTFVVAWCGLDFTALRMVEVPMAITHGPA